MKGAHAIASQMPGLPGSEAFHRRLTILLACAAGAWLAFYLYGGLIDPREVAWLLHENDPLQHYLGWHFFRRDDWQWPLGEVSNLASSVGASIVYTDSIPLVALALKPFHAWLPDPLQYLGLVMLANLVLNAGISCALLQRSGVPAWAALFASLLFVSLPMATMRGLGAHGHEALSAHWLLLLGIWLTLYYPQPTNRAGWRWLALLALAVLIHFYLFFMVGVMWAAWWCGIVWRTRAWRAPRQRLRVWLWGVVPPVSILLLMWAAGYFHYGGGDGGGYGVFSAELLTYFNPLSRAWFLQGGEPGSLSFFLPGWETPVWGQYEGQAYAGLGGIGVLLAGVIAAVCHRQYAKRHSWSGTFGWLLVAVVGLFVFALSDRLVIGGWLVELHYARWLGPLPDTLRSSGRLAWPLLYVLLLAALLLLASSWPRRRLLWVLAGLVILQWIDLNDWHASVHQRLKSRLEATSGEALPYAILQEASLEPLWQSRERIVALPPEDLAVLRPYAWLAAEHDMSLNIAHLARASQDTLEQATRSVKKQLKEGQLDARAVYVLTRPERITPLCRMPSVQCREYAPVTLVWRSKAMPTPTKE